MKVALRLGQKKEAPSSTSRLAGRVSINSTESNAPLANDCAIGNQVA